MEKLFKKHETLFCILLIILYVIVNSYCVQNFGTTDYRCTIINTIFSCLLIGLMVILKKTSYYGINKVKNINKYLYFIPLVIISTVNLWNGINMNNSKSEIIYHIFILKCGGYGKTCALHKTMRRGDFPAG